MVEAIRQFFDKYIKGPEAQRQTSGHDPLHLATAALMIEVMRMDGDITEDERQRVLHAMEAKFALRHEETAQLLRLAEEEAQQATDYFQFTSLIKDKLTPEEKERLIEHLWAVAYADGELHLYEEHLIRKLADLLYVSQKSLIAAKLRAQARS